MTARTLTARAAASVLLAGGLLLGTAGCTFVSEQATLIQYDPSDGIGADIGDVQLRNVIALPSDDGHAVSLLVTLINTGGGPHSVTFQYESAGDKKDESVTVKPGEVVSFGTTEDAEQLVFLTTDAEAGSLFPVYVQYGKEPGQQLLVPVLAATGEYEALKPPEILRDAPAS